jgi:hypothetical protein
MNSALTIRPGKVGVKIVLFESLKAAYQGEFPNSDGTGNIEDISNRILELIKGWNKRW